jgi:hypothetical protein
MMVCEQTTRTRYGEVGVSVEYALGYGIGKWTCRRGTKISCEMADVAAHEDECGAGAGCRTSKSAHVSWAVAWCVQQIEAAVAEEVVRLKSRDGRKSRRECDARQSSIEEVAGGNR